MIDSPLPGSSRRRPCGFGPAGRWLSTGLLTAASLATAASAQVELEAKTFQAADQGGSMPYRMFSPEIEHAEQRLPLVLFLHGAGERGTNNKAQLRHGVASFTKPSAQQAHPCYVIAPQCPSGIYWPQQGKLELCLGLIDELQASLPIDPHRIYVTGLSMGGYGTWHLLSKAPDRFAAAVPICGGGVAGDAERFVDVPIWAFHGDADNVVSVAKSREMVRALEAVGGAPKYTEYEGVRHNSWGRAYGDRAMHDWMFAQRLPAKPLQEGAKIVFLGDSITEQGAAEGGYIPRVTKGLQEQLGFSLQIVGAGIGGNRVPDLQKRLDKDVLAEKPDVVVIYIGINDVWHFGKSSGGTAKEDFRLGLLDLVSRIRAENSATRILLCTPSVIGEKHDGSNHYDAMLDDYSALSRGVAGDCGLECVDLREAFMTHLREHNADNAKQGILTRDTVHLSDAGNELVARQMVAALAATR